MAIKITNLVGPKPQGVNFPEDVLKVKNSLNQISAVNGGLLEALPNLKLDETSGIFDQKLFEAIQRFQIRHFGWAGADGKIYPNGTTIGKINELLPDQEKPVETEPEAKTNIFFLMISPALHIIFGDMIYLKFDDILNRQSAKYIVESDAYIAPDQKPQNYTNQQRILWQGPALSVKGFDQADFQYGTHARNQMVSIPPLSLPQVTTENMMGIKTVKDTAFRYFHTGEKPSLLAVVSMAMDVTWTDKWDQAFARKIVGKLSLVEFETW
jgi:hypothetical protein